MLFTNTVFTKRVFRKTPPHPHTPEEKISPSFSLPRVHPEEERMTEEMNSPGRSAGEVGAECVAKTRKFRFGFRAV
jgi:hypothetical protein